MIGGEYIVKRLHFDTFEDLISNILEKYSSLTDEYGNVTVVAKYDEAKEIIKELLRIGYDIACIDINNPEYDNYFDEYFISLNFEGVWCEKSKNENKYYNDESEIVYILDNCSSKIIEHCISTFKYEVNVGDDDYEDDVNDKEDDIHGFTVSNTDDNRYHSFSYYTTNPLTEKDIQNMIENLGFSFSNCI